MKTRLVDKVAVDLMAPLSLTTALVWFYGRYATEIAENFAGNASKRSDILEVPLLLTWYFRDNMNTNEFSSLL